MIGNRIYYIPNHFLPKLRIFHHFYSADINVMSKRLKIGILPRGTSLAIKSDWSKIFLFPVQFKVDKISLGLKP